MDQQTYRDATPGTNIKPIKKDDKVQFTKDFLKGHQQEHNLKGRIFTVTGIYGAKMKLSNGLVICKTNIEPANMLKEIIKKVKDDKGREI